MLLPSTVALQHQQIYRAVAEVERLLHPSVQRIRFEIGQDWSGDWSIFFRILLSDEASREHNLRGIAAQVEQRLSEKIDFPALGIFAYFNFRSQSEQAELREPAWAE